MQTVSWKRIILLSAFLIIILSLGFYVWYYVYVFSPAQASTKNLLRAQEIESLARRKYCPGTPPYPNDAVRYLCTGVYHVPSVAK